MAELWAECRVAKWWATPAPIPRPTTGADEDDADADEDDEYDDETEDCEALALPTLSGELDALCALEEAEEPTALDDTTTTSSSSLSAMTSGLASDPTSPG